jgi:hypothetical protein
MRISGSDQNVPGLNLLGHMSKIGNRHSNLIFVYPLLFDKYLFKRWDGILRDFLTAQFISQIKISNVLNITQSAVQGYGQTSGMPYLNPAEILNQALSNNNSEVYSAALQTQLNAIQAQQFNSQNQNRVSNTEYAYKLQELRQFIKQQVLTDPMYDGLRPAFSIISMENSLLDIPLIVGTKSYKIDSSALYWILFISLLNNRDLSLNSFDKIEELINNLPKGAFIELISSANLVPPVSGTTNVDTVYNQLRQETNVSLKRALETFKKVATTLNEFESDIGFSTSISAEAVQYSNVLSTSIAERAEMKNKITGLLNQTIVSSVFPVLQTINNLIVNPALETNYMQRYRLLLSELLSTINPLVDNITGLYSNRFAGDIKNQSDFLKSLESNCKSLQQLNSFNLLSKLNEIQLKFTSIRRDVRTNAGTNSNVHDFAEDLIRVASSLTAQTQTLLTMISNFTGDAQIRTIYSNFTDRVRILLFEYYTNSSNDLGAPIVDVTTDNMSSFFASIFRGANKRDLIRFVQNSTQALSEVISFLVFYSTISYFCEFISIIKSKIEIQSKDVIEFPNYTLIIPIEFVTTLYYALAARNVSSLLKNMNTATSTADFNNASLPTNTFKLSETEIFRIVSAIVERIGVKNIIIVDSNKKEIYYKWAYSKRPLKLNESTLSNYIKSQANITSAF